jgi:hypothetical protein
MPHGQVAIYNICFVQLGFELDRPTAQSSRPIARTGLETRATGMPNHMTDVPGQANFGGRAGVNNRNEYQYTIGKAKRDKRKQFAGKHGLNLQSG